MHMLLILLILCLRKPGGISHLFSIAYAFAGNGCLSYHIFTRSMALAKQKLEAQAESPHPEPVSPESPVEASDTTAAHIPAQFLTEIHGKQFVQYAGLLAMAHERGLQKLESRFISVNSDLAIAEATAEFSDGKIFKECADSTPSNVNPKVKQHFPRM